MKKRLLSICLTLALCLGLLPSTAWAADPSGPAFTTTADGDTTTYTFTTFHNVNAGNSYGAQTFRVNVGTNVVLDFTHVPQGEVTDASFVLDLTADALTVTVKGDPAVDYGKSSITVNAHPTVSGTQAPVDHFLTALCLENFQTSARIDIDTSADHPAPVCFDGACRVETIAADYLTLSAADDAASLSLETSLWGDGTLTMDGGAYQMGYNHINYPQVTIQDANITFSQGSGSTFDYRYIQAEQLTIQNSTIQGVANVYSVERHGEEYREKFADSSITIQNSAITYAEEVTDSYYTGMLCNAETITIEGSTITGAASTESIACIGGIFEMLTIRDSEVYIESDYISSNNITTAPAIGSDRGAYTYYMRILGITAPSIVIEDSVVQAVSRHSAAIGLPRLGSDDVTEDLPQLSITIQGASDITATSVYSPAIGGSTVNKIQDDGLVAAEIVADNPGSIGAWEKVDDDEVALAAVPAGSGLSAFAAGDGSDVSLMAANDGTVQGNIEAAWGLLDDCAITIASTDSGTPTISAKSGVLAVYGSDIDVTGTNLVQATMVRETGSTWSVYPMETPGDVTIGSTGIGQLGYGYASVAGTGIGAQSSVGMNFGDSPLKDVERDSFQFTTTSSGFEAFYVTPQALPLSGALTLKKGNDTVTTAAVNDTLTADLTGLSPIRARDKEPTGSYLHLSFQWYRDGAAISGATGTAYKLVEADSGKIITCVVSVKSGDTMFTGRVTSSAVLVGTTSLAPPTLDSRTKNSITLVNAGTGYTYSKDYGQTWQSSTTFENLTKGTAYTFILKDSSNNLSTAATFYTLSDKPDSGDFSIDYEAERLSFPAGVNLYSDAECQTCLNAYSPWTWIDISGYTGKTLYARYRAVEPSDTQSVTKITIPARPEVNQVSAERTENSITFAGVSGVAYRLTLDDVQVGEIKNGDGTSSIEFTDLQPGTEYVLMMRKEASNEAKNFRSAQVNQPIRTKGSYAKDSTLLAAVDDTARSYDLTSLLGGLDIESVTATTGSFVTNATQDTTHSNSITLTFSGQTAGAADTVTVTAKDADSTLTLTLTVKAVEAMAANEDGSVFWVREEAHPGYVGMDESKLKSAWTTGLKNAGLSNHTNENSFALVPRYVVGGGTAALVTDEPEITWTVDGVADAASTNFTVLYVDASRTAKQVTDVRKDNGTLAFSAQSQTALYLVAWKEIQAAMIKVELRNNTTTRYTNVFLYGHSLTAYITVEKGSTSLPYPGGAVELYLGDPNADGSMKLGEGTLSSIGSADISYTLGDSTPYSDSEQTLYIVYSGDENYNTATKEELVYFKAASPDKPVLTATPFADAVKLTWDKPEEKGTPITGYELTVKQNGTEIQGSPFQIADPDAAEYTVSSLESGKAYTFTLKACSAAGSSSSKSVTATPLHAQATDLLVPAGARGSQVYNLQSLLSNSSLTDATVEVLENEKGIIDIDNTSVQYSSLTLGYDTINAQAGDTAKLKITTAAQELTLTLQVVEVQQIKSSGTGSTYFLVKETAEGAGMEALVEPLKQAFENNGMGTAITEGNYELFALLPRNIVGGGPAATNLSWESFDWTLTGEQTGEEDPAGYRVAMARLGQIDDSPWGPVGGSGKATIYVAATDCLYLVAWQKYGDIKVTAETAKDGTETDDFQYGDTLTVNVKVTGMDSNFGKLSAHVVLYQGGPSSSEGGTQLGFSQDVDEETGEAAITYKLDDKAQYDNDAQQTLYVAFTTYNSNYQNTQQSIPIQVYFRTAAPGTPKNLRAQAQVDEVRLTWSKPQTYGEAVTGYTLVVEQDGMPVNTIDTIGPDETSYTVQNLTGGQTYTFKLTAASQSGQGTPASVMATPLSGGSGTILAAIGASGQQTYDLSRWLGEGVTGQVALSGAILSGASCTNSILSVTYRDVTEGSQDATLTVTAGSQQLTLTVEVVEAAARTGTVFWVEESAADANMTAEEAILTDYLDELGMGGADREVFALLPRTIVGNSPASPGDTATISRTLSGASRDSRVVVLHIAEGGDQAEALDGVSWNGTALTFPADGGDGLYLVAWQGRQEAAVTAVLTKDGQESNTFQYGDTLTAQITVTGSGEAATGRVELRQGTAVLDSGELDGSGKATLTYTLDNSTVYGSATLTVVYEGDSRYTQASKDSSVTFEALAPDKPVVTADPQHNAVELAWQAPDTRGAPITGYTLVVEQGGTIVDTINTISANDTSYTVQDLTGGLVYTFTLTAHSGAGDAVSEPVTAMPLADGTEVILLPVGSGTQAYDLYAQLDGFAITNVVESGDSENLIAGTDFAGTTLTLEYQAPQAGRTASLTVTAENGKALILAVETVELMARTDTVFWVKQTASQAGMAGKVSTLERCVEDVLGMTGAETEVFALLPRTIVGNQPAGSNASATAAWIPDGTLELEYCQFAVVHMAGDGIAAEPLNSSMKDGFLQFSVDGEDGLYLVAWQGRQEAAVTAILTKDSQESDTFQYGDTLTAQITVTGSGGAATGRVELRQGTAVLDSGELDGSGKATLTYTLDNSTVYGSATLTVVYEGDSRYTPASKDSSVTFEALAPDKPVVTADPQRNAVELAWQAPDTRGAPITGYTLVVEQGGTIVDTINTISANDTSYTVPNLTGGLMYTFTLTARSGAGGTASDPVTVRPLADGTEVILLPVGSGTRAYDLSALLDGAVITHVAKGADEDNLITNATVDERVLTLTYDAARDGGSADLTVTTDRGTLLLTAKAVNVAAEGDGVFWVRAIANPSYVGMDNLDQVFAAWTDAMAQHGFAGASRESFAILPRTIVGGQTPEDPGTAVITWTPGGSQPALDEGSFLVLRIGKGEAEADAIDYERTGNSLTFTAAGEDALYAVVYKKAENGSVQVNVELYSGDTATSRFRYGDTLAAQVTLTPETAAALNPSGDIALYLGNPEQGGIRLGQSTARDGKGVITWALTDAELLSNESQTLYVVYQGDNTYLPGTGTAQAYLQLLSPSAPVLQTKIAVDAVTLTWNKAEPAEGVSPVTGYTLVVKQGSTIVQTDDTLTADRESCTVSGLTGGLEYTFILTAHSDAGDGQPGTAAATPLSGHAVTILIPAMESGTREYNLSTWLSGEEIRAVDTTSGYNAAVEDAVLTLDYPSVPAGSETGLKVHTDRIELTVTVKAVEVAAEEAGVFWVKESPEGAGMTQEEAAALTAYLDEVGMGGAAADTFALLPRTIVGNASTTTATTPTVTWTGSPQEDSRIVVLYLQRSSGTVTALTPTGEDELTFPAQGQDGLYLVAQRKLQDAGVAVTPKNGADAETEFAYGDTMVVEIGVTGVAGVPTPTGTVELHLGSVGESNLLGSAVLDAYGTAKIPYELSDTTPYSADAQTLHVTYSGDENYHSGAQTTSVTFRALAPDRPVLTAVPELNAVTLQWTKPKEKGTAITGYTLVVKQGGTIVKTDDTISADRERCTVSGLAGGLEYTFILTARSGAGDSQPGTAAATPTADEAGTILIPAGASGTRVYDLSRWLGSREILSVLMDSGSLVEEPGTSGTMLTLTYGAAGENDADILAVTAADGNGGTVILALTVKAVTVLAEQDGTFFVREAADPSLVDMSQAELTAAWDTAKAGSGFQNAGTHSFAIQPRAIVGGEAVSAGSPATVAWTPSGDQVSVTEGSFLVLCIGQGEAAASSIGYQRADNSLLFSADGAGALYAVACQKAEGGPVRVTAALNSNGIATSFFRQGDTLTAEVTVTPETTTANPAPSGAVQLYLGDPEQDGVLLAVGDVSDGRGVIIYKLDDKSILSHEEQALYVVYPGDSRYLPGEGTVSAYLRPISSGTTYYYVTVADTEHGTVTVSPQNAPQGSIVTITATPDTGYELASISVTGSDGKEIEPTDKGGGIFTFTMPGRKVTVEAVFTVVKPDYAACGRGPECPLWAFTDLDRTAWYHDGVHFCLSSGMMEGYGSGLFGPEDHLSRAMLVQILYNYEGRPAVSGVNGFGDVGDGAWYTGAVTWAAEHGIVNGYGNGNYGPEDPITREQLVTILYRYAQAKGRDVSIGEDTNILSYTDALELSEYAIPAMQWACGTGIVEGYAGALRPQGTATRAEAATMLMRFCEDGAA